ncbi:helix-turn-helix domain-containing protein [Streptomyces sp. MS19]|uniref:helix-turn-helix domain-containing protein n=1 Tax=Streptomyces sp. MS19 TaxID=3385972 RepID=UPI00399F4DDD
MSNSAYLGNRVSTVLGRRLGSDLSRLRDAAGMTQAQAAAVLDATATKIVKMEHGWVPMREPDLRALCDAYRVSDPQIVDRLLALARIDRDRRKTKGWWSRATWSSVLKEYLAMEEVATRLRCMQLTVIPGLLQTPDYVQGLFLGNTDYVPVEFEEAVNIRLKRQQRLYGDDPLKVQAIIWEGALRQLIGSPETMRHQLGHLIDMADHPSLRLQVLPFNAGAIGCPSRAYTILTFDPSETVDVVYEDGVNEAFVAENEEESRIYDRHFQRMAGASLDTVQSRRLIEKVRKEL